MNPVPDLVLAPPLRCAARRHAVDQAESGELGHQGSDGSSTLSRVDLAQYDDVPVHELLAGDFTDPERVVEAWLGSTVECEAIFDTRIDEFGLGYARSPSGGTTAWVLLTGEFRDE